MFLKAVVSGLSWHTIFLIALVQAACTPFNSLPSDGSIKLDAEAELSSNAKKCLTPGSDEPDKEELSATWPTPVCPKVEKKKCPICPAAVAANKVLLGEIEMATIDPPGFEYLARIDTGATSTSIHAHDIKRFERDGDNWVRFKIDNTRTKEEVTLERKLIRRVRIKQTDAAGDSRLTVILTLKIGKLVKQIEVSLADRSNMEFPVLIGRNFLIDTAVVDVSVRRIAK